MSPSEDPIKAALWAGVLAVVNTLPKSTSGTSRSIGDFTLDGPRSGVDATFSVKQPDGASKVYAITVAVEESRDDHDDYWGPGGERDRDTQAERVVVDGIHYLISDGRGPIRGFSGRRFDIEFFDGRRVSTRDLWHQGTVPPKWRDRYPDNARFVTPEPIAEAGAVTA